MSKSSSKKRIIIAASLFAIFLIGAIVSVVVVLAAQTQNVQTNISIAYIVDGVGANVQSSYAIVPVKEDGEITRTSMSSSEGDTISFGVSEQESTAEMKPTGDLYLDSMHQQIVFEYYFESTSDAAFSIQLLNSPGMNSGDNIEEQTSNMLETFYVSRNRLDVSDYRDKITDSELKPQALTELGQHVYIYVSAKVENENLNAYYNGMFTWQLSKQDTITINLDDGDTTRTLKVIPNTIAGLEKIAMPPVAPPETTLSQMFMGYNTAEDGSGTTYINRDSTTPADILADIANGSTLYAQIVDAFVVDGTTITGLTTEGQSQETLYIPSGITTIGDGTNVVSTTATTIYVPNTVTTIAANAFSGNTTIEYVNFEAPVETAAYADGEGITTIGNSAFSGCTALKEINIPEGVTTINSKAFYNCTSLKEITIPETVTSIAKHAFYGTTALEKINYNATACANLSSSNYVFYNAGTSGSGITVNVGANVTKIPSYLFYPYSSSTYSPKITTVNFAEGSACASIGTCVFYNCTSLKEIIIPEGVTSIQAGVFQQCSSLTKLEILSSSLTIGSNAFTGCSSLVQIRNLSGIDLTTKGYTKPEFAEDEVTTPEGDFVGTLEISDKYAVYTNGGYKVLLCSIGKTITTANDLPSGITQINQRAFSDCNNLTSITIPSSVTSIGERAFYNRSKLATVTFGENSQLTSIGEWAFYYCSSLTSITIPSSVTSIGDSAFYNCSSLTSVTIPSSVISIGDYAFYNCSLTSVSIPSSVMSIGDYAFYCCDNITYNMYDNAYYLGNDENPYLVLVKATSTDITSCEINENTKFMLYPSFEECGSLTEITIPENISNIPMGAFSWCSSLTSVSIPSSVTTIGDYTFYDCSGLKSVTIPASVTSIGQEAFYGCGSLTDIYFGGTEEEWNAIENLAYAEIPNACTIRFSSASASPLSYFKLSEDGTTITGLSDEALAIENLELVIGGSGITTIGEYAFVDNWNVISVELLEGITTIEDYAFDGYSMSMLTSITLPETLTTIGNYAFNYCMMLTTINIPSSVTTIGESAFYYCDALETITFSNDSQLMSIGSYAFYGCYSLTFDNVYSNANYIGSEDNPYLVLISATSTEITECEINQNTKVICSYAFENCTNLTNITIPDSVIDMGANRTFYGCSSLVSINIPDQIKSIGWGCFEGCSSLKNITIPSNVTTIERYTFYECSSLTSITIPESVTSIGDYAFSYCSGLTSITIPSSVTNIGIWAFSSCSSLTSVTISSSVTSIGSYAFYSCSKLTSVTFGNTSGWFVSTSSTATSGTNVTLSTTDLAANATLLKTTHYSKYWKRSA